MAPINQTSEHPRRGLRRRPAEWLVGNLFGAATRVSGLRLSMIPAHMRRQLEITGVQEPQLERVLRDLRSLADWPYAWEDEGDRRAAEGNWLLASVSYYVGQRLLLTDSPLKRRLYGLARAAYLRVDQPPLEHFCVAGHDGATIAGYLQLPPSSGQSSTRTPLPTILMIPGVTGSKEELHAVAQPFLCRGFAVARIDNPQYGETTGLLEHASVRNPARVLDALAGDARLDRDNLHLLGMSMGGFFALHSAPDSAARSVITIAAPCAPDRYLHQLPGMNITAISHMTGLQSMPQIRKFCERLSLHDVCPTIDVPVKLFHGGRDRTVPISEVHRLADAISGPVSVTIWDRDHHTCLEHFDEIVAESLEWLEDPAPAVRAWQLQQAFDTPRPATTPGFEQQGAAAEPGLA